MLEICIVGSLKAFHADPNISGSVISLKHLINQLSKRGVPYSIIDTGDIRRSFLGPAIIPYLAWKIFKCLRRADILTLHLSPFGFAIIGPVAIVVSKALRKPVIFRMFGGMGYFDLKQPYKLLAKWTAKKLDGVLLQSKALVKTGEERGLRNVEWFPTTRPMPSIDHSNPWNSMSTTFVFIAQIKRRKGIFELIEAAKEIGETCKIDVYGPFYDGLNESIFSGSSNVKYQGVAKPEEVSNILKNAKALVFPTYLAEEGYPGILLEALGVGCPIICSRWRFLPEIVNEECAIFCEPKSVQSLRRAIQRIVDDPSLANKLSKNAYNKRMAYSIETGTNRFLDYCEYIVTHSVKK